jgi:hypothetical protein
MSKGQILRGLLVVATALVLWVVVTGREAPHTPVALAARATEAALVLAGRLQYAGVLCVEFFVLADGRLVVNEMAPRPHNSGHYTIDACVTSQFEQQARVLAGLPLGSVFQHTPAVMLNLLGDCWFAADGTAREPDWAAVARAALEEKDYFFFVSFLASFLASFLVSPAPAAAAASFLGFLPAATLMLRTFGRPSGEFLSEAKRSVAERRAMRSSRVRTLRCWLSEPDLVLREVWMPMDSPAGDSPAGGSQSGVWTPSRPDQRW